MLSKAAIVEFVYPDHTYRATVWRVEPLLDYIAHEQRKFTIGSVTIPAPQTAKEKEAIKAIENLICIVKT